MANEFITLKNIARQTLPRLVENLVMPSLVWNDFSETFSDLGDTIQIKKPVELEAKDFTIGGTVVDQDIKEPSVDVKLDKIATVDVSLNALEAAVNWSPEKFNREFIEPSAVALAQKINLAGIEEYVNIPNLLGTAGTTPSAMSDFSAARKFLNKAKAPMTDRYAIWDVEADAKFTELSNLFKVNEAGWNDTLRQGQIGSIYGLENFMTQAIEPHDLGGAGTVLVDGSATKGATALHVDGVTTALKKGDMFTIAGDTTKYTVVSAGALDTADQDLVICPALQANAADNAAITLISTRTTNNLVFHKTAIAFVTRPLHAPEAVPSYTTSNGQYSLRVVKAYDRDKKMEKLSMDVLYGYKVINPDLAARYLG